MKTINTMILGMLISTSAMAIAPSKYKKCDKKILEPKASTGFYWDENCSAVFVMPPAKNTLKIDSMALNVTDQECSGLKTVLDKFNANLKKIKDSGKPSVTNQREIKRIEKKIISLNKQKEQLVGARISLLSQKEEVKVALIPIDKQIIFLEDELTALSPSDYKYSTLERKLAKLKKVKVRLEGGVEAVSLRIEVALEKEEKISELITTLKASIGAYMPPEDTTIEKITELYKKMNEVLSEPKSTAGGTLKVIMSNEHTDLVNQFKKKNRGVNIVRMPTDSSVQFKVSGMAGLVNEDPLEVNIPGVTEESDSVITGYSSIKYGESLSGSVRVSTLSSCMLKWGQQRNSDLGAHFVVNLLHKYNLSVKNDYTLEYNLSDIYKKVKSSTSKGGFFKTKSINSVSEYATQKGSLKVTFNSEDPRDNYDKEEKYQIKNEFVARTLEQISLSRIPYNSQVEMTLPEVRGNVATGLSRNVKKCKHLYCQIAGYALDLGNALFGSAEASATYLRSQNFNHTEVFNETKVYPHFTTSSFEIGK